MNYACPRMKDLPPPHPVAPDAQVPRTSPSRWWTGTTSHGGRSSTRHSDSPSPSRSRRTSTSDHIYTGLGIPKTVTGNLHAQIGRAGLDAEEIEDLGETGASAGKRTSPGGRGRGSRSGGSKSAHLDRARTGTPETRTPAGPGSRCEGSGRPTSDGATSKPSRNRQRRRTRGGRQRSLPTSRPLVATDVDPSVVLTRGDLDPGTLTNDRHGNEESRRHHFE